MTVLACDDGVSCGAVRLAVLLLVVPTITPGRASLVRMRPLRAPPVCMCRCSVVNVNDKGQRKGNLQTVASFIRGWFSKRQRLASFIVSRVSLSSFFLSLWVHFYLYLINSVFSVIHDSLSFSFPA